MGNIGKTVREASESNDLFGSKASQARTAYENLNSEDSIKIHDTYRTNIARAKEEHQNESGGEYIKSIVFGGMDGIITTFAVVAGAAGADLGSTIVLILGFSNLFADGLSMGLGDYISESAENDYVASELARETWEFENYPEGEKKEMVELYEKKGFSKEDATELVDILSRNKDYFIDNMMVEELGLLPPDPDASPAKHGLVTFVSFLICGLVPLLPFMIASIITKVNGNPVDFWLLFWLTCALTASAMFALGAVSAIFSIDPWWKCGLFTLANGVVAAAASYLIGFIVNLVVVAMGLPPIDI